jgi:hypothetical protein
MLAKDYYTGKTLERLYLKSETINSFITLVEKIKQRYEIKAIVVDGRKGILNAYPKIPTQMCQFHQIQIINRYLTRKSKLEASKELRKITLTLTTIKKELFIKLIEKWYQKWETLLKEKTINQNTKKWFYTHKKLRSAYRSLKTNLPYLFTYQEKQNRHLKIPNTTNLLDGFFSHLKNALRVHRGLNIKRKIKIIETIIWR